MNKHVYLLRHAKSDWSHSGLDDKDRPLTSRGKKDAPSMCALIEKLHPFPDKIYSSTAKRSQETIRYIHTKPEFYDELYSFDYTDYVRFLQNRTDDVTVALVVGHNPSIEELISYLLGTETGKLRIPTASLVSLELSITNWSLLHTGCAQVLWHIHPKLIKTILL